MRRAYAVLFSDVHIHGQSAFSVPTDDGSTSLLDQGRRSLQWVARRILEHRPCWALCLGDVGHVPGVLDAASLKTIVEGFAEIQLACCEVGARFVCLVGNHDTYFERDLEHKVHSLHFLSEGALVASPRVLELEAAPPEGWSGKILGIPYSNNYGAIEALLSQHLADGTDLAILHTDALYASWNHGRPSGVGVRMGIAEGGPLLVFNGHHHHPEVHAGGKWIQVGSLMARSFNDSLTERPRGISVLHLDRSVEQVENPHSDLFATLRAPDVPRQMVDLAFRHDPRRVHLRVEASEDEEKILGKGSGPFKSLKVLARSVRRLPNRLGALSASMSPEEVFRKYADACGVAEEVTSFCCEVVRAQAQQGSGAASSVTFLRGSARNFLSYRELDLDFQGEGVRLIEGQNQDAQGATSNGSGKTACVDLLPWVIYNRTTRGVRGADACRRGAEAVTAQVSFLREGKTYLVQRSFARSSGSLRLFCDGEDISCALRKDTQERLEHALGLSEQDFFQICALDLARKFQLLSDSEKKALIESFSETPAFLRAEEAVRALRKDERIEVALSSAERGRIGVEARLQEQRSSLASLSARQTALEAERAALLQGLAQQRDAGQLELENLHAQLDVIADTLDGLDRDDRRLVGERLPALRAKAAAAAQSLFEQQAQLGAQSRELEQLQALASGHCPLCQQPSPLPPGAQDRLEVLGPEVERASQTLAQARSLARSMEQRHDQLAQDFSAWTGERERAAREMIRLQGAHTQVTSFLASLEVQAAGSGQDRDQIPLLIADLERSIVPLEGDLSLLEKQVAELEDRLRLLEAAEHHLGPMGVRSFALDRSLDALNAHLLHFSQLFGGDLTVWIEPERSTKEGKKLQRVELRLSSGSYASSSQGERARIDLTVAFALRALREENLGTPSLLVVDECDNGLDLTGVCSLIQILEEMEETRVLFVTHNALARQFVPDTLQVVKVGGVSRILGAEGGAL